MLVSAAPEPGSTPQLRRSQAAFRERFGREPGPYAAIGYEAMRTVLAAIAAAGERANGRQAVIDTYFGAAERTGPARRLQIDPRGRLSPRASRPPGCVAAAPSTSFAELQLALERRVERDLVDAAQRARDHAPVLRGVRRLLEPLVVEAGHAARVVSATSVIVGRRRRCAASPCACVWIDSGALPPSVSTSDSAIEKQPACAAAISSSGLVPLSPSSKRDLNE